MTEKITIHENTLVLENHFSIYFNRTLKIPDDGKSYPLPPGLGKFPLRPVKEYSRKVPEKWLKDEAESFFFPMYQREAMWISWINQTPWKPLAVKVGIGKINAVSGEPWSEELGAEGNDYLVVPPQPWLDGINAGAGTIKQFIAMPLGMGYTVEGQITGEEKFGGIQLVIYQPKEGIFKESEPIEIPEAPDYQEEFDEPLYSEEGPFPAGAAPDAASEGAEMGLGAGGQMTQEIYPDPHGIDTWNQEKRTTAFIHIVNSVMYTEITGEKAPDTPIDAATYTQYGYPWFDLYSETLGDIKAPDLLQSVKSVKEIDKEKGLGPQQDDSSVEITEEQRIHYKHKNDPSS